MFRLHRIPTEIGTFVSEANLFCLSHGKLISCADMRSGRLLPNVFSAIELVLAQKKLSFIYIYIY